MIFIIKRFVFRTADSVNSVSIEIDQRQVFRVVAGGIAGKSFMIHRNPVPVEIFVMLHFLHHGRILSAISIISADDLKGLFAGDTAAFPVQSQILILQCVRKENSSGSLKFQK